MLKKDYVLGLLRYVCFVVVIQVSYKAATVDNITVNCRSDKNNIVGISQIKVGDSDVIERLM